MHWLVVQHVLAFGDVTLGGTLVELSPAVGTLYVLAGIADWRRRQIAEFSSRCQMRLHLLSRPYGVDEVLVLAPPVGLHLWFLRFLKQ